MKLLFKSKNIKANSMFKVLMSPLLGLTLCIICLMGTTWSWFTDNVTASVQSIKAADYSITVDIKDGEELEYGKYSLSQMTEGNGYPVTVRASGSASTGYFRISGPEGFLPLYSTQLAPGEVFTFTFYPSTTGEYYFESAWGTYTGEITIKNSDIIGTPIQSDESVVDTERLEDTEISSDTIDSTSTSRPNEGENTDKDINADSGEEINKDLDEELNETTSTVQSAEVPLNVINGNNNLEESVLELPVTEGTSRSAEKSQE